MCLIIHKPDATTPIPAEYIDNAEDKNPDGFGIVYLDNGEQVTTMDYNYARHLIEVDRPLIAHYRYATRGEVNLGNCHPFVIEQDGDHYFFTNGTIADLGNKNTSDTLAASKILATIPQKYWGKCLAFTDTRVAIVSPDLSVERYGKWHERDGIFYSKNDCFYFWNPKYNTVRGYYSNTPAKSVCTGWDEDYLTDDDLDDDDIDEPINDIVESNEYGNWWQAADWKGNHYLAVYGTLKAGYGNHDLLGDSHYIGKGVTLMRYPMQTRGSIPYVFRESYAGHNIDVEVYNVENIVDRDGIDALEAHPYHYKREQISIKLHNGKTVSAWLYFGESVQYNKNETMIQTY